jgi:hypothetical protein
LASDCCNFEGSLIEGNQGRGKGCLRELERELVQKYRHVYEMGADWRFIYLVLL